MVGGRADHLDVAVGRILDLVEALQRAGESRGRRERRPQVVTRKGNQLGEWIWGHDFRCYGPHYPPMSDLRDVFEHDLQASEPEVRLGLSRAGVRSVSKAIRIRYGPWEKLIAAEIDCTVDLDGAQKGVHMSRFP